MSDTKILQLILDGQVQLRKEVQEGFAKVNKRIDMLGESLAYLGIERKIASM